MAEATPVLYFLCTGNAARSVMAKAFLEASTDAIQVRSAGTHVVEGCPPSLRTRTALARHDVDISAHRSHQMATADAEAADLVVAMEPANVAWIRRHLPELAPVTATMRRWIQILSLPAGGRLALSQIAELGLADVELESWEEVVDPAGGEQADFDRCAEELVELVERLRPLLP